MISNKASITTGNDYAYDANGNMTVDKNKKITAIYYNHLNLPRAVVKGTGEYLIYTYDASGRKLSQTVYNSSYAATKNSDYSGEYFYENDTLKFINHEEGRIVMSDTSYQYHLKDHLGNVRMTFTTKNESQETTATLETASQTAEMGQYVRYTDAKVVYATLLDHTNGGSPGYSQRLNGSTNEKYGLARSLSVMPGDTVKMEVYAKYIDPNTSNWSGALSTLMGQIAGSASGVVVDGINYSTSTSTFPSGFAGLQSTTSSGAPKAYLNWLVFDRSYRYITGGFKQITTAAKEAGSDISHERIAPSGDLIITEPGYVYIYLSNEETSPVEVFFDDFKVTHVKSPVIETNDYYSGGAMFNTYARENSLINRFKYQHKEFQDDLGINLSDFHWRQYDPWTQVTTTMDPESEKFYPWSPYSWEMGDPVKNVDHDGRIVGTLIGTVVGAVAGAIDAHVNGKDVWAGAAEGATAGAIAGAVVDLTVATGGGAAVVIGAAAAGGALGSAAGDVVGQVVTNTRSNGGDVSKAVSGVNFDNTAKKALTGAATGLIGGVAGAGVGKALGAVTNSTKAVQAVMSKNIVQTAKTLNGMGASAQTTQKAVDKIVQGMGAAGKNTANAVAKTEAAATMVTEGAIKTGEAAAQNKKPNQ